MSSGGFRVSIPNSSRKTIQNIKEITGHHSEEEIYAMLKECSMDPNETAQKLLLQDPFHEVKSKRDKRKESLNNRESAESRWRPGTQGRGSRGGHGNYSARYASHDAGGGKNSASGKQSGTNQVKEKGGSSSVSSPEAENKEIPCSVPVISNGPSAAAASGSSSVVYGSHTSSGSHKVQHEVLPSSVDVNSLGSALPPNDASKNPSIAFGTAGMHGQPTPISSDSLASMTPASSSAGCFSSSDPVLLPSNDPRQPGIMGTIKREVGSQRTSGEENAISAENKSTSAVSEVSSSFVQGKMPIKSQGGGKNQLSESSQPSSAIQGGSLLSRPSSNYSNRSQVVGSQKVGSNKEWKPKPTNPVVAQGPGPAVTCEVPAVSVEASAQPRPDSEVLYSEKATSKLPRKVEGLQLKQRQHVILPNHIHVPESERTKLSFGSFGANFGLNTSYVSGSESDKSSTPVSETSQVIEATVEEQASSNQIASATNEERDLPDQEQSSTPVPENSSLGDGDTSASTVPEYNESKQDTASLSGGHQYSVVHTSPNYNLGFVSPMLGSQLTPFENSESQARDVSRLPGFVVQQPFDPASYYAQFYRSGTDNDGRLSPFPSPGVATKYNGNVTVLPPQTSQSQEGANSLVLSTAGPTPLATQAAGLMQNSLVVTQQPVPVFRPPAGMHISHYPPNYLPYGHYFSPFYVPPPMHQFISNGAFPQQPQAGNVYPAPSAAAATGVKYPLPQYKPGGNTGNSTHIGMPSSYGPYGSSPTSYNPSSATTAGNSTTNEDLGASQFKDSNTYIPGQQSEGSAVWIGRDISNMPASSFYNLPPQGQHMTFTPTQAGHGTFAGIYHPAQAVTAASVHPLMQQSQTMAGAADMVGPTASVYQQPQHSQINWPSNY